MKDGLYCVDYGTIHAAFVVREGEVTTCAPILRQRLDFFKTIAKWIPTDLHLRPVKNLHNSLDDNPGEN